MTMFLRQAMILPFIFVAAVLAQIDPVQQGVALFRQGGYEEALREFQAAKRARPNDASLENLIGITETKLGRIADANRDYEAAVRLDPKLPEPRKNLAFNYLQAGQYAIAEKQLKTALGLDIGDPAVHYYLVLVYLSMMRDRDVVSNIQGAEPLLKNDLETAILAIKTCLRSGASAQAKQLIEVLEKGKGFSVEQEYDLAKAFGDQGMYLESAQRFRRVLETHPESWETKYNLALNLAKAKQTDEASRLLTSLAAEHSKDPRILSMVASAAEFSGNSALALNAFQSAIAADPHNADSYLDCTRLLMDLNRYNDAAELVKRGVAQVQDPYPLTIRLGAIEMMRGDHEAAKTDYREAIEKHPEIALGYVALAQAYMKDGNDQEALKILSDGRTRVSSDFALEYAFGLTSLKLGQQEQAIEALTHAEELNPEVIEPHYQLGLSYMKQDQWKKAQEEFESVLRIDQSHAAAYYQLSRIYARMGDKQKAQQLAFKSRQLTRTQQDEAIKAEKSRLNSYQPQ
jgi:Flp pilus assembly protein TadD